MIKVIRQIVYKEKKLSAVINTALQTVDKVALGETMKKSL